MSNVGKELKKEREAQGKTRAEVAKETGIYAHHLAALEHGNFDDLPDDDTVAGFVKTYAEHLGFLSDEPVAEFRAERSAGPSTADEEPPEPLAPGLPASATTSPHPVVPSQTGETSAPAGRPPKPKRPLWHWVVVVAAVIIVLVWFRSRGEPEPVAPETEAPAAVEEVETATPEPEPAEVEPPAEVPAVEQPAASTPPAGTPAPTMTVTEHGVGTGVENRALVGQSERFTRGAKVYFWTRVRGGAAGDEIRHVWVYEGRDFSSVTLRIGSSNWRTQSSKTMFDGYEGTWAVEARDADGNVLARSEFTCEP